MWQGKNKALTFSYDDGVTEDRRLVKLFKQYGMQGTFNLNSGLLSADMGWNEWQRGMRISHIDAAEAAELYKGFEVAVHTRTHPDLCPLSDEQVRDEIAGDKAALEKLTGQEIVGMAYPGGTYDDRVIRIARESGIRYARTVKDLHAFALPEAPMAWATTCHHNDDRLFAFAEQFIAAEPDQPQLFAVWGHSYEFDVNENWDRIERLCEMLAGRDDIFYATNREALSV